VASFFVIVSSSFIPWCDLFSLTISCVISAFRFEVAENLWVVRQRVMVITYGHLATAFLSYPED
jgi:hypothetical protein